MANSVTQQRRDMTMTRIVTLLTNRFSSDMVERHVRALQRLVRQNKDGFLIRELDGLVTLLAACCKFVGQNDVYVEPLCNVVKLCGKPFLKEKASDEKEHGKAAVRVMIELGGLIECDYPIIHISVCRAVVSLFTAQPQEDSSVAMQRSSLKLNIRAVEESHVAKHLARCLLTVREDGHRLEILEGLQRLSVSGSCCCDMLQFQAAHSVCSHMLDVDSTDRLLVVSIELLWNLIERGSKEQVAEQLSNLECINVLQKAFCRQMIHGKRSQSDRELRNDILTISHLVAAYCPDAPFVESGFVRLLVLFSTFTEVKSNHDLVRGLRLSQAQEDFELKKLLISMLVTLSSFPAAVKVMMDGYVLLALFSFVQTNDKASTEWTPAQFEELQLEVLAALAVLSPLCVEAYLTCQGSTRLLLLLEWCASEKGQFVGLGNSFHGDGGHGNRRSQMRYCLHVLLNMTSLDNTTILTELCDQAAVQQLVQLLHCEGGFVDWDSLDEIDLEMRHDILLILSALCDSDLHRKELFGEEGVASIVPYIRINPCLFNSGQGHYQLTLVAVVCCWSTIVGCGLNETLFLELEGMFLLLDLLEACPGNAQSLVLGLIVDLCENPKSVPHMLLWKGQDGSTVANLLIRLWQEQEALIKVQRDENGLITDRRAPLAGENQRFVGVRHAGASDLSPAILDIQSNMRAKIYALFNKIGFSNVTGLSSFELITLAVIEQYLDLKLGEVWREINDELIIEKLEPIASDRESLEQIVDSLHQRAIDLCSMQHSHLQSEKETETLAEQRCYDRVRESRRMDEKAKVDFDKFVRRTSDYQALKFARVVQRQRIENSRVKPASAEERKVHLTHQMKLQTTTFSGRHVNVDSTQVPTQQIPAMQA